MTVFFWTQGFRFDILASHHNLAFQRQRKDSTKNPKDPWVISFHSCDHSKLSLESLPVVGQKVVMASFPCQVFWVFSNSTCIIKQNKTKKTMKNPKHKIEQKKLAPMICVCRVYCSVNHSCSDGAHMKTWRQPWKWQCCGPPQARDWEAGDVASMLVFEPGPRVYTSSFSSLKGHDLKAPCNSHSAGF